MVNYGYITKENIERHNPNWPQILDRSYRISIFAYSRSGKANALLNPIKQKNDGGCNIIDKIYSFVKNPNEAKNQYLIKKH